MRIPLERAVLELVRGDITEQDVDAIVNAANKRLAGGGGVDGAIHDAGGPTLMEELKSRYPGGCSTGDAVVTAAGLLKAKFVIHAVGPSYVPQEQQWCADRLTSAYRRSLELASEHGCRSVAFPSLSTGIFHYPTADAARIALRTARDFLAAPGSLELVRWVLFDDRTFEAFTDAAREVFGNLPAED
jgi:O-acetyl-ADP-ribose deacetylase (regulator of RNase III)